MSITDLKTINFTIKYNNEKNLIKGMCFVCKNLVDGWYI